MAQATFSQATFSVHMDEVLKKQFDRFRNSG